MKCNHCLENFVETQVEKSISIGSDKHHIFFFIMGYVCPGCGKNNIFLERQLRQPGKSNKKLDERMIFPRTQSRMPIPPSVPEAIAEDYLEACMVLDLSPKASAALSRRCLQNLLVEKEDVKKDDNLFNQIKAALENNNYPSHISENIDMVRSVGNFAAHPKKSEISGAIIEVEPGEADFNLNILEDLFDYYYTAPLAAKKRKDQWKAKMEEAKKKDNG